MTWDVIARALFVDNGAAAGLAKFNAQIHEVVKAAPGGTRGFRAMETGLQSLALEAVGIQGPIGKVAEGLLRFGGGSALVIGAVAGIGLIATAYRLSAAEAEKLQASNEKLAQSWRDTAAKGKPLVARANELQKAVDAATAAQEELNRLSMVVVPAQGPGGQVTRAGSPGEIALAETGLSQAEANVRQIRALFQAEQNQLISDSATRGQKWAAAFLKGIEDFDIATQLRVLALGGAQYERQFGTMGAATGRLWGEAWVKAAQAQLERGLTPEGLAIDTRLRAGMTGSGGLPKVGAVPSPGFREKFAPREYFISDLEKTGGKARPDRPDPARLAAEAVALLGALQQGGAGGILSAGGGLLSGLSGLKGLGGLGPVGIVTTAVGGFFSLFDHSQERRQREQMAELTRIRQNTDKRGQPDHISVTVLVNGKEVTGAILQDVMYGIRRAERTNAVPVLPPSGG